MKIGFIGAGNMGGAILKGYSKTAREKGDEILVCDHHPGRAKELQEGFGAQACDSIEELVAASDIIIVGVKPNVFADAMEEVKKNFDSSKLLVSMAAGITIDFVESFIGKDAKIVRIMPNTPAQVGEAMVAVCRNGNVDDASFKTVFGIFEAIGCAEEVSEDLIHCVIGVSGSSPAYTFMYIEALINAAVKNGMDADKARKFAAQAVLGAARMVLETDVSAEQLRINVCSPGGTTIEAVDSLFESGFEESIEKAFQAAVDKSIKMSGE